MKPRLFLFFHLLWIMSFNASAQYQVNCISENGSTITLRSVGYGKNAKIASANAEVSVIKALLFYGIPDTQQSVPLIQEAENTVESQNKSFFNKFYGGEYKNVITRSVITRKFAKDENKQKSIALDITVNIPALRNILIKNGVIRNFGL